MLRTIVVSSNDPDPPNEVNVDLQDFLAFAISVPAEQRNLD